MAIVPVITFLVYLAIIAGFIGVILTALGIKK